MTYRVTHSHPRGAGLGISALGSVRSTRAPARLGFQISQDTIEAITSITDLTASSVAAATNVASQVQQARDARAAAQRASRQAARDAAADALARRQQAAADADTRRAVALRKAAGPTVPPWLIPVGLAFAVVVTAAAVLRKRPSAPAYPHPPAPYTR